MNYETRERAMKFAIEWAYNETYSGCSVENIISAAEKFESYLGGTWGEPEGCLEGNTNVVANGVSNWTLEDELRREAILSSKEREETSDEPEGFVTVQLPVGSYVTMFDRVAHKGEPEGSLGGKNKETRLDRLKAMRRERNGLITLEFPDYLVYTMGFGERFENSDTTEETAED